MALREDREAEVNIFLALEVAEVCLALLWLSLLDGQGYRVLHIGESWPRTLCLHYYVRSTLTSFSTFFLPFLGAFRSGGQGEEGRKGEGEKRHLTTASSSSFLLYVLLLLLSSRFFLKCLFYRVRPKEEERRGEEPDLHKGRK